MLDGIDIIVVAIGVWPKSGEKTISAWSDCANAFMPAIKAKGIKRFFMVVGSGFAVPEVPQDWEDGENPMLNMINIVRRDVRKVWEMVLDADLDYTFWCPGNFPSGPRTEDYITAINSKPGPEATTGMVADSMIKEINNN